MEILPPEVTEFLATVELSDSANAFLASNTCELASKYEEWRRNTGKPELANSAKGVVYSWKQDVTRKQRENIRQEVEAASKAKKIKKVSSTGSTKTPPSARREALEAKKQSISSPSIVGNTTNSAPASTTTKTSIIAPKSILLNTGTNKELSRESHDPSPCMDSNKSGDNNESVKSSELIFTPHNHVRLLDTLHHHKVRVNWAFVMEFSLTIIFVLGICECRHFCLSWDYNLSSNQDVLSGRGGATNQHVGNTWYRR